MKGLGVDFNVDNEWVMAAEDVSYEIHPGEILAIVGESGSGKSMSSMALLGLLPRNGRSHGSARMLGKELIGALQGTPRRVRGNEIAMIFQEPMTALNPVLTVGEQIREAVEQDTELSPPRRRSAPSSCCAWWRSPKPNAATTPSRTSSPAASASGP